MLFSFILCWLIGLLKGMLFTFVLFYVHDGPLIAQPGPAPMIGWTGWLRLFYAAYILLVFFILHFEPLSTDAATQTKADTAVHTSTQTDEIPLGVVVRDAMGDTLLPGIARLLDTRLAPPPQGEGEQQDDGSEVEAVLHWLADLGPDPDQDDDNQDYPAIPNGWH
ncbi:hypothetical protein N7447_004108 [Penicillium robsamsonii]|uniref:uncharacterized protein n=1 Tax=Penicillium robsamsonii TaxID=1792511 RepID=UPI002548F23F|nr:uncharacterized protein N7447_004108 [Penicillium robsamsonii]KAJ5827345.1 hypothetical protein N7447_004108 [Penicillium robsamsonii]